MKWKKMLSRAIAINCDENSDSEIEHISDASEDDDDELSCETDNYGAAKRNIELSRRCVINKNRKIPNYRPSATVNTRNQFPNQHQKSTKPKRSNDQSKVVRQKRVAKSK